MARKTRAFDVDAYLDDPVRLIKERLILEHGQAYGECIQSFQEAFFQAIFIALPDGRPRYRLLYDERRRGESKTEDVAAAAVTDLFTGPNRHRSYVVASDQDQAGLVLDSISGFLARSPILSEIELQKAVARNAATGSELRVLSADAPSAFGIRPRKVFFDELSLQPDEKLWLPMWSAVGKRKDAQMVAVSMAGWDFSGLAWRIRELAHATPGYYFASREGSELAPWLTVEQMEEQRATLHPSDFARFWECRWTEPLGAWITPEMYASAERGREAVKGDPRWKYAGFVDIGLVRDATAVAVCHSEEDRVVLDTLSTMRGSKSAPVELEALEDLVIDLTRRFGVGLWVFEAPQAVASVQRLEKRLRGRATVRVRYPTSETQARLFGSLYQLFASQRLVIYPHDQLRRECLNLVTKTVGGRLKVVESTSIHQDHTIALGGAADLLMREGVINPSDQAGFAMMPDGITWQERVARLGRDVREVITVGKSVLTLGKPEVRTGINFTQVGPRPSQDEPDEPEPALGSVIGVAGQVLHLRSGGITEHVVAPGNWCDSCERNHAPFRGDADCPQYYQAVYGMDWEEGIEQIG